ncbi:MAG: recombinase family protein, partial [Candidatus Marinimicrobia bacterium]|nr:recombinase family protein [Candidatus Neomarinimicrobiota bacterium]
TTMEGKLFRGFLILFAEFEREQGKERTFLKRYSMAKEGCWLGGMPPIGYKLVNKELVVVEEQASLIREIFSLYLKKYPPSEISRILNNQGLKTPNKTAGTGRIYGNKKFNTNTILTYLKNPAYSGFVEHNNELFKGKHAAIISKEDWDAIQTSFNIKKESPRLGTGDTLLLTGILKCGECNSFMTTSASLKKQPDGSKKRYWYYRCTTKTRYGAEECKNRQISAPSIENYIIEYIAKIAENDNYAIKTKDKINFQRKIRAEKVAEILERKQGEKAALSKNINNITNAIAMTDDDSTIKYLIKNLDELTNQQKLLDGEISKRELILNGLQKNEATLEHLRIRLKEFSEIFYKLTQSDKRIIIKILIKEIVFSSPKESEKGRLKLRFWKKPDFEFEYDVNSGLRFEGSGSGGRT